MKLRFLSFLVLLIFAFQALPVAAMGKLCMKQKVTVANSSNSILDDLPPNEVKVKKIDFSRNLLYDACEALTLSQKSDVQIGLHSATNLPKDCFIEIDSPPPNFL